MRLFTLPLLLFILIAACIPQKLDKDASIKIEHIGPSDKPIAGIIIVLKDGAKVDWQNNVLVEEKSFAIINRFILSRKTSFEVLSKNSTSPENDWADFRITSRTADGTIFYIISSASTSIQYFSELKTELITIRDEKGIPEFLKRLNVLQNRINQAY